MKKKFKFKHKIEKSYKDKRGIINILTHKGFSSCMEVFSKKGSIRANHYHKKDTHYIYVLKGKILFFFRDRKKNSKLKYEIMKKGDLFFTKSLQDHMAFFLENSHFFAFSSRKRTHFNYENDLVRLKMHEEKMVENIIKKFYKKNK
jgi:quercetin dioxygenase-like cupin family protein